VKCPQACRHEGAIADCGFDISEVIAAVREGKEFYVHGTCQVCGNFVEREYSAGPTLATLQAELLKTSSLLVLDTEVHRWTTGAHTGIPAEIFVVHPGEGMTGACGRNGMALLGVRAATKEFVYKCKCGFEWSFCAHDIDQMIVQGLHKSMAARRAPYLQKAQRSSSKVCPS
jgi:hypothetical protein